MGPSLSDSVRYVKGVGPKKALLLRELGILSLGDLIEYFPFRIDDFSRVARMDSLVPGEEVTVRGRVISGQFVGSRRGGAFRVGITDGTGVVYLVWYNMPYMQQRFDAGQFVSASGRVEWRRGGLEIAHPMWHAGGEDGGSGPVVPVYHVTQGLTSQSLHSIIKEALPSCLMALKPLVPASILKKHDLIPEGQAYRWIHSPDSADQWEKARKTLAFREMLLLQTALISMKREAEHSRGPAPFERFRLSKRFLDSLPFRLTPAQERAVSHLADDLSSGKTMNRLLQGDVGSGKTVVAMYGLLAAVENGWQGALLAPTEILATQHRKTFEKLAPDLARVGFLSGATPKRERESLLEELSAGDIDILIGTHALLGPDIRWRNLGFVVTDEQHRFGVKQRLRLPTADRCAPHVLVMSATPIPRSLALTLYGDLDVTVIDSVPPGRTPVHTTYLPESRRKFAYQTVRSEVDKGRQAFVVCPAINESQTDKKAAVKVKEELDKSYLRGLKTALVHGSLSKKEIEQTMESFARGEIQVLVSTTVIEVGIDVPNATVMVIEDAGSFGLATLHQLRGRVGRGDFASSCFLIGSKGGNENRLKQLEKMADGFQVAEMDLQERGPGQFFGTAQHGMPDIRATELGLTLDIITRAREEAKLVVEALSEGSPSPESQRLGAAVKERFGNLLEHGRSR
ncbi:MAG: ATP-dependent DNA helicase RecG [Bacillota bacterium]|jgi:ATP-dependent DNA helicase RecG